MGGYFMDGGEINNNPGELQEPFILNIILLIYIDNLIAANNENNKQRQ
jgi:hypothetical protein